ncbi:MAG: hypothetical protein Q9193_000564 [Seirophora villosa]
MVWATRRYLTLLHLLISLIPITETFYVPVVQDTLQNWHAAVTRGKRLFDQLQSGCSPDAINPIDREGLRAIGFRIGTDEGSRWPPVFKERSIFTSTQMKWFRWSDGLAPAYWRTSVDRFYSTPWPDETKFYNEYSPRNGLIASLAATKSPAETLNWSDVTFAMWEAVASFTGRSPKELRFIAQHFVRHPFTLSIITRLVDGKPPGVIRLFGQETEAFFALLGTPFGAGAVYLLMQHKKQLGHKTFSRVTLFGKSPNQWSQYGPDIVFEIRDVSDPAASAFALSRGRGTSVCQSLNSSNLEAVSQL